jgi:hypothetical protein
MSEYERITKLVGEDLVFSEPVLNWGMALIRDGMATEEALIETVKALAKDNRNLVDRMLVLKLRDPNRDPDG